ncbi:MAG: hypothetical protein GXP49_14645 [Deltaproteobacteria bacterium]|nr:hypothetical protein [Deltaproteobacteria bacterium]
MVYPAAAPFSSFSFVESEFNGINSVRRCFSLARSLGMQTVTLEEIPEKGIIADENDEISRYFRDYECGGVIRLGFWTKSFRSDKRIHQLSGRDLIGYAILKRDIIESEAYDRWHVFEAVFKKYPHPHNCIPAPTVFKVTIGDKHCSVRGVLYCQQNSLNKACAHVALRSLLSRHLPEGDITYRKINDLAGIHPGNGRKPGDGLNVVEIRKVLEGLGIGFRDIDYTLDGSLRETHPYQKFLYAGIESGAGSLLGFHFSGPVVSSREPPRHIIPFFGHTFNKDTWVPDAELSYFNVGGGVGYVPSENWTSSFIGHDDNFGSNYCVPRLYVSQEQADYVVELLNKDVQYSGVQAEAVTLNFIYSLQPFLAKSSRKNNWNKRLVAFIKTKKIVLRAIFIPKSTYLKQLKSKADWDGKREDKDIVGLLENLLPDNMWVVEISLPQLFPANERKIGEVLLNPYVPVDAEPDVDFKLFLMARLPGQYFFLNSLRTTTPDFLRISSTIQSHMPLIRHAR